MSQDQRYSASFIDGMNAFRNGKSIHYNPYRNQDVTYNANLSDWEDGYTAAQKHSEVAELIVQYQNPWFVVEKQNNQHWIAGAVAGGAVIIPVTQDRKVILVEQFRPAVNAMSLEFPRGGAEPEDAFSVKTARRELREEVGVDVPDSRFFFIGSVTTDTGVIRGRVPVFMALVEEGDRGHDTDDEIDRVVELGWDEVYQKVQSGEIFCGFTLSSMTLFHADQMRRILS